ncbi:hypothetical protein IKL64_06785 [bacterium]|nr:hypothetical protein [bacterium]
MAKINSLARFENSLKEFLINALTDKYGDAVFYSHRYHNLKVYIDPRRTTEPHFYVSIGISEACFSLSNGKLLNGSLGDEDNYVKRWSERTNINKELKKQWQMIRDAVEAEDSGFRKCTDESTERRTNRANSLQVDMTGTGIDKTKKQEIQRKKERFASYNNDEDIEN